MKKEYRLIIIGFAGLILLSVVTMLSLSFYMNSQTERDVREIAQVYLEGMTDQEGDRFEAIKSIRFTQMDSMRNELAEMDTGDADAVQSVLSHAAAFQQLANCSLISASGELDTVYGRDIERLGDISFLLESMEAGSQVVTGGWTSDSQIIIYAAPVSVVMENGETSIGLLWCKPIDQFADMMNLDNSSESRTSLAHFHIIRRDTSYVIQNEGAIRETYTDKMLTYMEPEEMSSEEAVAALNSAIETNGSFYMNIRYTDEENGISERRSIQGTPLADSNWYLISVLPYGVLDETIEGMGHARTVGMIVAIMILSAGILVAFFLYMRLTRRQVTSLQKAHYEIGLSLEQAEAAQREAEAAREEAERSNRSKSEFLSNMSHDIRTPMNAIVGLTAIAKDHLDDTPRVEDCLQKITISGKQLLGLINDVLDMSKIESGKMTLNPEVQSLRETMETMCDIIRPQIRDNGQYFDVFISDIISENVYCDGVRLNQVLLNLLSNAVKFTPEGGYVNIHMSQEESSKGDDRVLTHFIVEDNGIGMSEEFQAKIFEAFEREDSKRVQKIQGTGLGLTITKYIIDAMGGTITVRSAPGEGTSFHVAVDLERAPDSEADMQLPPWNILVVDDSRMLCQTAEESLRQLGAKPSSCLSGEDAVELVMKANSDGDSFHAVLIDYRLKGMNGVETAVKLRDLLGSDVPISLISAYDWADIEDEALQAGITGFIPKPLFKSTLYHELIKYTAESPEEEAAAPAPADEKNVLEGMHVLLAEDQFINAEIARVILTEAGAVVDHAEDGKIACELFSRSEENYYEAILMDLRMPHMDGLEATAAIRAMRRSDAAKIQIIAMTADAFAEDAKRCIEAGMNAHMSKPIDQKALIRVLQKIRATGTV